MKSHHFNLLMLALVNGNCSAICKKPLKRLEETVGETSGTGLKFGVNEKIHLLHTAE